MNHIDRKIIDKTLNGEFSFIIFPNSDGMTVISNIGLAINPDELPAVSPLDMESWNMENEHVVVAFDPSNVMTIGDPEDSEDSQFHDIDIGPSMNMEALSKEESRIMKLKVQTAEDIAELNRIRGAISAALSEIRELNDQWTTS